MARKKVSSEATNPILSYDWAFFSKVTKYYVDKHTTTLSAYFNIFDDLQYSRNLWTQCATQTLF